MIIRLTSIVAASLLLTSCAISNYDPVEHYLSKRDLSMPTAQSFQSCRGYGCQYIDEVNLTQKEWRTIDRLFRPKAKTAQAERKKITQAIAQFEKIVGSKTGTSEDIWGTFQKGGHKQQDCVDESTNTTIYMLALKERGHIKHNTIGTPQSRVPFLRWPHQTAVIQDNKTSERYAVDSWFHNNGKPPEIIDFKTWKDGWKPKKDH